MKFRLLGVAVVTLLLIAGACGGKENKNTGDETVTENLGFETFRVEKVGEYEDSDSLDTEGERFIRFVSEGVLPRDLGKGGAGMLRDSLMRMARLVSGEDGKPEPLLPDSVVYVEGIPDSVINCSFRYTSLSTTLLTPQVVVWEVERETYAYRAAHGNRWCNYLNYSLSDGKVLRLADLMNPDYEKQLTEIVRNKIKDLDIQLLVSPEEIELPKAFAVTSDGLLFSYNPYAVAPYSEGIVKVSVGLDEIYDLLSPRGVYILTGRKNG